MGNKYEIKTVENLETAVKAIKTLRKEIDREEEKKEEIVLRIKTKIEELDALKTDAETFILKHMKECGIDEEHHTALMKHGEITVKNHIFFEFPPDDVLVERLKKYKLKDCVNFTEGPKISYIKTHLCTEPKTLKRLGIKTTPGKVVVFKTA